MDANDPIGRNARNPVLGRGRRCTATNRAGEQCKRAPIIGGFICVMHGGGARHVREAARDRILGMVDPALDVLLRALNSGDPCTACGRHDDMGVVIRAAQLVLDRAGLGPSMTIEAEVKVAPPEPSMGDLMARGLDMFLEQIELALASEDIKPGTSVLTADELMSLKAIAAAVKRRMAEAARLEQARRTLTEAAVEAVVKPPKVGFD
jgi:hypothetical protein